MHRKTIVVHLALLSLAAGTARAATRYVTTTGTGDCSSWANACSVSQALAVAAAGDQLWVKAGTYPATITLKNGVKMFGGFGGTETAASQSNPAGNATVIDGAWVAQGVRSENNAGSTMLRGFIIRNGSDSTFDGGGGLLVLDSSATFVQCTFQANRATNFGAGVAIRGVSSPQFVNCTFSANGMGTGIYVRPYGGGAVYLDGGTPTFTNCLFVGNKAFDGGALVTLSGAATFRNCTFAGNHAAMGSGGALFDPAGAAVVRNCILWGNTSTKGGDQIYSPESPTSVTYSDVQGGWTGTGNINSAPLFEFHSYDLSIDSPCKDVGNDADLPVDVGDLDWDGNMTETIPLDLNSDPRVIDFIVDIGAYEGPYGLFE